MRDRWFKEAVIYCLDVETFQDSNGDGVGDLPGLISRLDYLERLGVTCLWLNPIHPTPNRDDGYDVADFYGVDPRLGNLGDFVELIHQAANRGLRVIIDLVINHTSDKHPWFQAARSGPDSPFRDYYVWTEERPKDIAQGMVFPGVQKATWTKDRKAKAWYYHRFYDFEPELNAANPRVREEVKKIAAFWLQLGVAGFRLDAAPFVIELTEPDNPNPPKDFDYLRELRELMSWRKGDTLVLAEANAEPAELTEYFGSGDRLPMLFNFLLNQQVFLGMARGEASAVLTGLTMTPAIPKTCQWATFLRNHDEIDLGRLTDYDRNQVFEEFGPEPEMQLYGRGNPASAGAHARRRPPADRDGLQPAVHPAGNAGHPLRGGDRHGRRPLAPGTGLGPHADAVVGGAQRRVLDGKGGGRPPSRDCRRGVRLSHGQCHRPAARPPLTAVLDGAGPAHAA